MDQVHLSEVSPYMAALLQRMYDEETIRCPHCNGRQSMETYFECVTYHGEEDPKACTCDWCGRPFWVEEIVTRVFVTTKIGEEIKSEENRTQTWRYRRQPRGICKGAGDHGTGRTDSPGKRQHSEHKEGQND